MTRYKSSREHNFLKVLGIVMLVLVMLVSVAGATSNGHIANSNNENVSTSNKSDETIKTDSQNSTFWDNRGNVLYDLNKSDEAIKAYDRAIEINPQNSTCLVQ